MSIRQHRQSINLTPPQTAFLDAEARQLGITVAELIRRILDEYRLKQRKGDRPDAPEG